MTTVHFAFTQYNESKNFPIAGTLTFHPTRKHVYNDSIVIPQSFTIKTAPDGKASVELIPSTPEWCWVVDIVFQGVYAQIEYVTVPDVNEIDYHDLPRVDPSTLELADPPPLWWSVIEQIKIDTEGDKWYTGIGPPPDTLEANPGDHYLDTDSGTIYTNH